jgi:hypothetical protein
MRDGKAAEQRVEADEARPARASPLNPVLGIFGLLGTMVKSVFSGLGRVCVYSSTLSVLQAAYAYHNVPPSTLAEFIRQWGMGLLFVWWVKADSRQTRYWPCYDFDTFLFFGWPVLLPYYLFRTRGLRGFYLVFAFLGLWSAPALAAALVYLVI